jgi:hypothetical protein
VKIKGGANDVKEMAGNAMVQNVRQVFKSKNG